MSRSQTAVALPLLFLLSSAVTQAQEVLHEFVSPHPQHLGSFGSRIAGVPDLDGDGRGDLLVGAWQESLTSTPRGGRAYILNGATGELLYELQSPNPDWAGYFGRAVAGVDDLDGDGYGDLLVGADSEDLASGRAYVFSGATGALLYELQSPSSEPGGLFGSAVAEIADVDSDGRSDLLIGAAGEGYPPPLTPGRAYVFSGATGTLLYELRSPKESFRSTFGAAVAGVPDADGDGHGDLLVGARGEGFIGVGGAYYTGRAYLFSGATGVLVHTLERPYPGSGQFSAAITGVPDADGDGRGDLLVGAPDLFFGNYREAGRAFLFSGATGALLRELAAPDEDAFDSFGGSVAGLPDLDGDGHGDLLIGSWQEDPAGAPAEAGRAHVFSGATGALLFTLASPNPEEQGHFGRAVAAVADTDGDGLSDLLIGATGEEPDGGPELAGRAYLFSGAVNPPGLALAAMATSPLTVAPGGSIGFAYTVTNGAAQPASGDLFYIAEQGGATVASGVVTSGTLGPGASASGAFTQRVPAGAPAGAYTYTVSVGAFPSAAVSEAFTIEVAAPARPTASPAGSGAWAAVAAAGWGAVGRPGAASAVAGLPSAPVTVHPNPLRERARVAFALDRPAEVRLAVYDGLGREVAVLVEGRLGAGRHAAAFEAGGLPSGTYLWRLEAGGRVETGRLTLLR